MHIMAMDSCQISTYNIILCATAMIQLKILITNHLHSLSCELRIDLVWSAFFKTPVEAKFNRIRLYSNKATTQLL